MINPTKDCLIGSLFLILFTLGTMGNILSFLYFWPNRRKSLPHKLYLAIVSVDSVTCVSIMPVALSLFNKREPMLFSSSVICCGWVIAANFSLRMSMFLVTVLSVSRSWLLVRPLTFKHIRILGIVLVTGGYAAWMLLQDTIFLALGWLHPLYRQDITSCNFYATPNKMPSWAVLYDWISVETQILLPSVIVFFSFLAGALSPAKTEGSHSSNNSDYGRSRTATICRVSTTIALFTALFLICNAPIFVDFMIRLLIHFVPSVDETLGRVKLDKWYGYGELILTYFFAVLNAALNPCLYMMRMPRFKEKMIQWSRKAIAAARHVVGVLSLSSVEKDRSDSNHEVVFEVGRLVAQDQELGSEIVAMNHTVAKESGGVALLPQTRAPLPIVSQIEVEESSSVLDQGQDLSSTET